MKKQLKNKTAATKETTTSTNLVQVKTSRIANPIELLEIEAEQEPDRGVLEDCIAVIRTLRNKDFSFREIAAWLSARGIEANHNAVYRVFVNNLSPEEAAEESVRDDAEKLKA